MAVYWIKAAVIAIGLLTALWIVASHSVAYRRTGAGRYLTLTLAYLWMAGGMLLFGFWFLNTDGSEPELVNSFFVLLICLSRVASLWWGLDRDAQYRHARDILLFRAPADAENPDPARGLHVPIAPAAPPSQRTERVIYLIAAIIGVVSILATIAFAILI
ncbi:MAG TPA: hypothetical protein VD886_04515 [Herpetosiphonaceae bacterium]|nr:hypothetical protein [Herpetosiphonaceae bacterium]